MGCMVLVILKRKMRSNDMMIMIVILSIFYMIGAIGGVGLMIWAVRGLFFDASILRSNYVFILVMSSLLVLVTSMALIPLLPHLLP